MRQNDRWTPFWVGQDPTLMLKNWMKQPQIKAEILITTTYPLMNDTPSNSQSTSSCASDQWHGIEAVCSHTSLHRDHRCTMAQR